ncbi:MULTISPECIES: hypothetical protein [unclassified Phyllobacterium]|uniref:hypothetical protein n=1 Tax=unclassified Phyllobacterium TaxID=2638441 RepID=UPI003012FD4E
MAGLHVGLTQPGVCLVALFAGEQARAITARGPNNACLSAPTISVRVAARKRVTQRAKKLKIAPEEYLRRIAVCSITDDLYAAVTDGCFEIE